MPRNFKYWLKDYKKYSIPILDLPSGPDIRNDEQRYWHLNHNEGVRQKLIVALVRRSDPDDLVALATANADNIQFKNKKKLYNALQELKQRGEWRHLGLIYHILAATEIIESQGKNYFANVVLLNERIRELVGETGKMQLKERKILYCAEHLRRFVHHAIDSFEFAVCPVCLKPQHGMQVEHVVALLDKRSSWRTRMDGNTLYVNRFRVGHLFDFDAIEVGLCTPDEIDTFCVDVGNDRYLHTHKRRRKIGYRVLSGIEISANSRSNLDKLFVEKRNQFTQV